VADNAQKTPFGQSLNRWGTAVAQSAIEVLGKSLPAIVSKVAGAIVTVNYQVTGKQVLSQVSMPVLGSRYLRLPFRAGAKGMTISADAYLGGMSGQGGGTADLTQQGNLATSAWSPVGSTDWPSVDPNTTVIVGESGGVLIKDSEIGSSTLAITGSSITLSAGGHTVVINATGVVIDGKIFLLHEHTLVQTGTSDSGPVA
jgi:hypothetical protein